MAQRIGSVLKESGQLRDYRVGVKFQDGVAWLNGTVTDAQQAEAAASLARTVPGVEHVVGQLKYEGGSNVGSGDSFAVRNALNETNSDLGDRGTSRVVPAYANTNQAQVIPNNFNRPTAPMRPAAPRLSQNSNRTRQMPGNNMPRPMARVGNGGPPIRQVSNQVYQAGGACPPGAQGMGSGAGMDGGMGAGMGPVPAGFVAHGSARGPSYDNAQMPGYAWPSYASYPNYAALTYPQQYSPTAWPYIGPFYPYPQVPLAWRKVALEWDDGWWFLDFSAHNSSH
jgi:BON domain